MYILVLCIEILYFLYSRTIDYKYKIPIPTTKLTNQFIHYSKIVSNKHIYDEFDDYNYVNKSFGISNSIFKQSTLKIYDLLYIHKPLLIYGMLYFIQYILQLYFLCKKFTYIYDNSSGMYVYTFQHPTTIKQPILFLHGYGFGVIPYLTIIDLLCREYTVIIPEFPSYFNEINIENICETIYSVIHEPCICIGHSLGTLYMKHFIHKYPHLCSKKIYEEPVCFFPTSGKLLQSVNISFQHFHMFKQNIITTLFIYYISIKDINYQKLKHIIEINDMLVTDLDENTYIRISKNDRITNTLLFDFLKTYPVNIEMNNGEHGYCVENPQQFISFINKMLYK